MGARHERIRYLPDDNLRSTHFARIERLDRTDGGRFQGKEERIRQGVLDLGTLLGEDRSRRAKAIVTGGIIRPVRIAEVGRSVGEPSGVEVP